MTCFFHPCSCNLVFQENPCFIHDLHQCFFQIPFSYTHIFRFFQSHPVIIFLMIHFGGFRWYVLWFQLVDSQNQITKPFQGWNVCDLHLGDQVGSWMEEAGRWCLVLVHSPKIGHSSSGGGLLDVVCFPTHDWNMFAQVNMFTPLPQGRLENLRIGWRRIFPSSSFQCVNIPYGLGCPPSQ